MKLVPPPRSPFASTSFEPRFVVSHGDERALGPAIELWLLSAAVEHGAPAERAVRHVMRRDDHLCIAYPRTTSVERWRGWETLDPPVALADLPRWIAAWLRTANYPKQPWFDGGERKGFTVFWAHYGCEEAPHVDGGALIVMTEWLEIHK